MVAIPFATAAVTIACAVVLEQDPAEVARAQVAAFLAAFEQDTKASAPEAFRRQAQDALWKTWEWPRESKAPLLEHVRKEGDGRCRAMAALALAAFHDPADAEAMLDAATADGTRPAARYWLLVAATCTLSIGDVWFHGNAEKVEEVKAFADQLRPVAVRGKATSLGRAHAATVAELLEARRKAEASGETGEMYGMALWHVSAYQLGHLDLASHDVLAPLLDTASAESGNLVLALAMVANRDFFGEPPKERTDAARQEFHAGARRAAKEWWREHQRAPDDLRALLLEGFAGDGVDAKAPTSAGSLQALRRLVQSEKPWTAYNACRLVNELAGTHFDLDLILLLDKYGMHPMQGGLSRPKQLARFLGFFDRWAAALGK